jgi:hypothetical protein
VLADARQVEHERLLELELHLVLDALEHRVLGRGVLREPPRSSSQLADHDLHRLARDQRLRPGDREVLCRGVDQVS